MKAFLSAIIKCIISPLTFVERNFLVIASQYKTQLAMLFLDLKTWKNVIPRKAWSEALERTLIRSHSSNCVRASSPWTLCNCFSFGIVARNWISYWLDFEVRELESTGPRVQKVLCCQRQGFYHKEKAQVAMTSRAYKCRFPQTDDRTNEW